jgi:pterin-4a-carbinolamine dehydratase
MNKKKVTDLLNSSQKGSEWKVQKSANLMTKRYDFNSYDDMRDFLDELEDLSEQESYYPDLTFSRDHVNVSIKSRGDELAEIDFNFSKKVDLLIN